MYNFLVTLFLNMVYIWLQISDDPKRLKADTSRSISFTLFFKQKLFSRTSLQKCEYFKQF